jgi:hypothetical protein
VTPSSPQGRPSRSRLRIRPPYSLERPASISLPPCGCSTLASSSSLAPAVRSRQHACGATGQYVVLVGPIANALDAKSPSATRSAAAHSRSGSSAAAGRSSTSLPQPGTRTSPPTSDSYADVMSSPRRSDTCRRHPKQCWQRSASWPHTRKARQLSPTTQVHALRSLPAPRCGDTAPTSTSEQGPSTGSRHRSPMSRSVSVSRYRGHCEGAPAMGITTITTVLNLADHRLGRRLVLEPVRP